MWGRGGSPAEAVHFFNLERRINMPKSNKKPLSDKIKNLQTKYEEVYGKPPVREQSNGNIPEA